MRPEILAVRAINQYRRRDILAYIGLRYYLENSSAISDKWVQEVSTHLVNTRTSPAYYRSYHFKEMRQSGSVLHRHIYIPGPNEILAETALLNQCAMDSAFKSSSHVYSYRFPDKDSKEGVYRSYFPGFRERHQSIKNACSDSDAATVLYTDIRKFYPSISTEHARVAWSSACDASGIPEKYREIGYKLIIDHAEIAKKYKDGKGILTGPMFSHLIANLVLLNVDKILSKQLHGKYWRYVDDIIIIGDSAQIKQGRNLLKQLLDDMGFQLHDGDKDFRVNSTEWLQGANDFQDSASKPWMTLIANIKRFLVVKPEEQTKLMRVFSENGINIPLLDYSNVVHEATYLEKLSDWLIKYSPWAFNSVKGLSTNNLLQNALEARQFYNNKLNTLLDENRNPHGYTRKRMIPKLRFYAGRLTYLAKLETMPSIVEPLSDFPELRLRSTIMTAIQNRDVSDVLKLGTNAVQSAAQILRISDEPVNYSLSSYGRAELQGLAILRLNGIKLNCTDLEKYNINDDLLNQFASGIDPLILMESEDSFVKEIACLRGVENTLRHESILDTAFDRDENLTFDVINQLHDSNYY